LKLSNGKNINLILIDTAGWERAKSISFTAAKNSHGIIMYNITNKNLLKMF